MELFNLDNINKHNELGEFTMDSHEFLNTIINKLRVDAGEPIVQHAKFVKQIEQEFSKQISNGAGPLGVKKKQSQKGGNGLSEFFAYQLNYKQMILMGMRSSKTVREAVYDKLVELKQDYDKLKNEMTSSQCATIKNKRYLERYKDTEDSNIRNAMVVSNFRMLWESGNMKLGLKSLDSNPHLTNFLLEAVGYKEQ